jgi:hypothetical protein
VARALAQGDDGHLRGARAAVRELDMRLRMETGIAKAPFVAKYVRC